MSPFFFLPPSPWELSFFLLEPSWLFCLELESGFLDVEAHTASGLLSNSFASSRLTAYWARLLNSARSYTGFFYKSSQKGLAGRIPTRIAIKWLLSSTARAWAAARLNHAKYCFRVSLTFCLMLAREDASGLIVLAARNCFLKSFDNCS